MPRHTGYASLPLHGGKAPAWLFGRMVRLSREIVIYLSTEFGTKEVLRRLLALNHSRAAKESQKASAKTGSRQALRRHAR